MLTYSFGQSGNGIGFCSTYKQSCGNCSSNHTLPPCNRIWTSSTYIYVHAWLPASYTVPQPTYALSKTVPVRHVRPWNGVYTARDSPEQPCAIVVVHQKRLQFKRGNRATRQCDITYIQRIYDAYKCHGSHIDHFGRFSIFYSPGCVAVSYIRFIPI